MRPHRTLPLACLLISTLFIIPSTSALAQNSSGSRYRSYSSRSRTPAPRPWRGYRSTQLQSPLTRGQTRTKLRGIKSQVQRLSHQGQRPVVVFDIDDTIVYHGRDNRVRTVYGSVNYVKSLHRAGANIVYLSARKERDRSATKTMLNRLGLPLASNANLLLNDTRLSGANFKRSAKSRVLAHGRPLALFDNDYAHVRNYRELYPQSRVFRLNTISRRRDRGGPGLIEVINAFF